MTGWDMSLISSPPIRPPSFHPATKIIYPYIFLVVLIHKSFANGSGGAFTARNINEFVGFRS
jgi:hypothetical protein